MDTSITSLSRYFLIAIVKYFFLKNMNVLVNVDKRRKFRERSLFLTEWQGLKFCFYLIIIILKIGVPIFI